MNVYRHGAGALAVILLAIGAANTNARLYTLTDLGNLGESPEPTIGTSAQAINDNGEVVGYSYAKGLQPFYWSANTGMVDIHTGGMLYDINNAGQVTGFNSHAGQDQAFIWTAAGGTQVLGSIGGPLTHGYAINNAGQVAGRGFTADGGDHAVLWSADGTPQDLGAFPNQDASALGINEAAQVVGFSGNDGFIWDADGGLRDLGSLGNGRTYANDINEYGQVVGSSDDRAFLWTESGGIRNLGTLAGGYTNAYAINDQGEAVGHGDKNGDWSAFIWTEQDGIVDLNSLLTETTQDWTVAFANDINNYGQIVGDAYDSTGLRHAVLLTPVGEVPEPTTLILFGTGLALLGLFQISQHRRSRNAGRRK